MPIHDRYIADFDIFFFYFEVDITTAQIMNKTHATIDKVPLSVRAEILDFSRMGNLEVGFSDMLKILKTIRDVNKAALWEKSYYLVTGDRLSKNMVTMITSLSKVIGAQYSIDVYKHLDEALTALDLPEDAADQFRPAEENPDTPLHPPSAA